MALAISSLPVPFSPWIRMLASLPATLSTSSNSSCIFLLLPMMLPNRNCPSSFCLSCWFSPTRSRRSIAARACRAGVRLDRLLEEAEGAGLHRLDRLRDVALAGDDDDLGVGVDLLELAQQLDAVDVGQHHVGDDDVGPPRLEDLFAARADQRGPDLVALVLEQDLQPLGHRRLVVDREHAVLLLGHVVIDECQSHTRRDQYTSLNLFAHDSIQHRPADAADVMHDDDHVSRLALTDGRSRRPPAARATVAERCR